MSDARDHPFTIGLRWVFMVAGISFFLRGGCSSKDIGAKSYEAWGDLNNDGIEDAVYLSSSRQKNEEERPTTKYSLDISLSDPEQGRSMMKSYPLVGHVWGVNPRLSIRDINGDGNPDVGLVRQVLPDFTDYENIAIYGDGKGRFSEPKRIGVLRNYANAVRL